MKEPLTDELLQELIDTRNLSTFTRRYPDSAPNLPTYLQHLLDSKNLTRAEVVRNAGLNDTHGYQIFMGSRGVSRDKAICLAFAMQATLDETNRLLNAAGHNPLYCKNRRDAIITFCLSHECTLQHTEEELYRFGEQNLGYSIA